MKNNKKTSSAIALTTGGLNITQKMRTALLMISEDSHYVCEWQTIVRLTEAGFISYIEGRACITPAGKELLATPRPKLSHKLASAPGLARARSKEWEGIAKKYDRYG